MTGSPWFSITYRADPLASSWVGNGNNEQDVLYGGVLRDSRIVILQCHQDQLLKHLCRDRLSYQQAIRQGGRAAQVAVTDYLVRSFSTQHWPSSSHPSSRSDDDDNNNILQDDDDDDDDRHLNTSFTLERLDVRCHQVGTTTASWLAGRRGRGGRARAETAAAALPPYMLERTDIGIASATGDFTWILRLGVWQHRHQPRQHDTAQRQTNGRQASRVAASAPAAAAVTWMKDDHDPSTERIVRTMMDNYIANRTCVKALLTHVAVAVAQDRLRLALTQAGGVAFVARGSILPRKSGASQAPMASPPAIPFDPPPGSPALHRSLTIDLGLLRPFIDKNGTPDENMGDVDPNDQSSTTATTTVTLEGLLIPRGITLICGGGYHGKSTLLRCIAAGVYNKIPGDGREYSVTRTDALSVRAEDGRYVQNCNISAFISNLPSLPGSPAAVDTKHFSTKEASGSTSQAANVVEALELGCQTMLVDEDVSAANFMARDGRMRALVMDESITPLLYRVNGLFQTHGVSSIVVVGGVGDWLDVPHHVLLMDKYRCTDATDKAKSVSKQFSHGHVQYAGRGVVHRLPWDATGTPVPRRPTDVFCQGHDFTNRHVALLDGGNGLALYRVATQCEKDGDAMMMATSNHSSNSENDDDDEDDERWIDMSRCEQLLGCKPQLYGCGLAALRLFALARRHPDKGLAALLAEFDRLVDERGLYSQVQADPTTWETTVATLGAAMRPRALEVGQAVCRLRGICLEEIPQEDDGGARAAARAEEERKKRELLEMWNNRRKK